MFQNKKKLKQRCWKYKHTQIKNPKPNNLREELRTASKGRHESSYPGAAPHFWDRVVGVILELAEVEAVAAGEAQLRRCT